MNSGVLTTVERRAPEGQNGRGEMGGWRWEWVGVRYQRALLKGRSGESQRQAANMVHARVTRNTKQ